MVLEIMVNTGPGNGLLPVRRQAITRTNTDPVHWRIYAALGGDELNQAEDSIRMNG